MCVCVCLCTQALERDARLSLKASVVGGGSVGGKTLSEVGEVAWGGILVVVGRACACAHVCQPIDMSEMESGAEQSGMCLLAHHL